MGAPRDKSFPQTSTFSRTALHHAHTTAPSYSLYHVYITFCSTKLGISSTHNCQRNDILCFPTTKMAANNPTDDVNMTDAQSDHPTVRLRTPRSFTFTPGLRANHCHKITPPASYDSPFTAHSEADLEQALPSKPLLSPTVAPTRSKIYKTNDHPFYK